MTFSENDRIYGGAVTTLSGSDESQQKVHAVILLSDCDFDEKKHKKNRQEKR